MQASESDTRDWRGKKGFRERDFEHQIKKFGISSIGNTEHLNDF